MVVDIGVNLGHASFKQNWREVVKRALDGGVDKLILTGTSLRKSKDCQTLAQTWYKETGQKNLYYTVGIHPHEAKTFNMSSLTTMRQLLQHPLAVAVGECGLDFNRDFSPRPKQIKAFQAQLRLACELQMPVFVHEREAHGALIETIDGVVNDPRVRKPLPPLVVHCFTGKQNEALEYIRRGYYIGFTGTICRRERGAPLRDILPKLPLSKLMVETDAPFMGFKKGKRGSEPADVVGVAEQLAKCMNMDADVVKEITSKTTHDFFRLPAPVSRASSTSSKSSGRSGGGGGFVFSDEDFPALG